MTKNDWHAGFVSAMKLELAEDEHNLDYEEEHNLANRAQRIDLLIIKKIKDVEISKSIGKAFRKFNIIEYKGPSDNLTYEDFHLVMAYSHLYFSEANMSKTYGNNDYSVTIIQEAYPREMFSLMKRDCLQITKESSGIYTIGNGEFFKMQIIVSRELPVSDYVWLKSLTKNGTLDNISGIIRKTKELDEKHKEYANNVMNVFTTGNADLMRRVKKEETVMCKAVEELFAEEHKKELEERDLALKESEEKITALTAKVEELSKLVEDLQSQIALG